MKSLSILYVKNHTYSQAAVFGAYSLKIYVIYISSSMLQSRMLFNNTFSDQSSL